MGKCLTLVANSASITYRTTRSSDTTAPCDAGRAATFNGTPQLVSPTAATTAAGSNTFTVESWFKTSTTSGGKIVGYGNAQTGLSSSFDKHIYMTNTGTLVFGVYPTAAKTITSPGSYNNGSWHYVAATLSTASMKLYVDGAQVAADPVTTTAEGSAGFWRVGGDNLAGWPSLPMSQYFAAVSTTLRCIPLRCPPRRSVLTTPPRSEPVVAAHPRVHRPTVASSRSK
jgi:hypothetical protein